MTLPGIPVSNLINVAVNLSPPAAQAQDIDSAVIVGTTPSVINVVERMRSYGGLDQVAQDFGNTTEEYLSAVLWFEQVPQPTKLNIGRWAKNDTLGWLVGGPLAGTNTVPATWAAITSGGFVFTAAGVVKSISGLNFSGVTNLNGVASIIQAALTPTFTGSTFIYNASSNNFIWKSGSAGPSQTVNFARPSAASGSISVFGVPSVGQTLSLNGTVVSFVSGTPIGLQIQASVTPSITAANIAAFVNSNPTADPQIAKFSASSTSFTTYLVSTATGTAGNSLTVATNSGVLTLSGGILAGGSASDVSAMIAMLSTSSGAYLAPGIAAESALTAVQTLDNLFGKKWYAATCPSASDADHVAIAGYLEGTNTKHFYGVTTQEGGVLVPTDTGNVAFLLKQLRYKKTAVQYSGQNPYAVTSLLARILTTDWNANNSTITLAYKQEPGIVAESISLTALQSIHSFNANVFVNYDNDTAIIDPTATCASGDPIDTIIGLDWFATTLQTALYNVLYLSATKIPQTDAGNHVLATTIESICALAVNNGLVAPGIWRQGGFGSIVQNQFLPKGYYVFQPPIAVQTTADRQARKSVPFQVALCLAGAVEKVNVTVLVSI